MRTLVFLLVLIGLMGCGGGDKSADGKGDSTAVSAQSPGEARGEKQVATYQSGDEEVSVESDGEESFEFHSAQGSVVSGGQEIIKGFPFPVYKDAKVGFSTHVNPADNNDKEIYQAQLTSTDTPEAVAAFYEEALNKMGLKIEKMDQKMDATEMIHLRGTSDSDGVDASVQAIREGEGEPTTIVLTWTKKQK